MEIAELADVQKQIIERFRKHTALIASDKADARERFGPGPDALGWGDVLELDLQSRDGSGCPFSATIGDSMAFVNVGSGQLDYLGPGSGTEEPSPDMIEQHLLDAIHGGVKEIEWCLGRIRIHLDTLRRNESRLSFA